MHKFDSGKGKTEGVGKRENEIECREKGNGRAPNLNCEARKYSSEQAVVGTSEAASFRDGVLTVRGCVFDRFFFSFLLGGIVGNTSGSCLAVGCTAVP